MPEKKGGTPCDQIASRKARRRRLSVPDRASLPRGYGRQEIRFSNALRENMYASMRQTSQQYAVQLSAKLAQAESFMNQLRLDENLRQAITEIDAGRFSGDSYLALEKFNRALNNYLSVMDVRVYSIGIATRSTLVRQCINSRASLMDEPVAEQEWFRNAVAAQGRLYWNGMSAEKKGDVLSIGCAVRSNSRLSLNIVGALNVAFYAEQFFPDPIHQESRSLLAYYHPETGVLCSVSGYDAELLTAARRMAAAGEEQADARVGGDNYYMMIGEPDHYGWITLYAMPADQISSVLLSTTMVFLAVTLACLLLILLFLVHMQTRLLRPLEDAIAFINENTLHQVELRSDAHGYPEIRTMRQQAALYIQDRMDAEQILREMSAQRNIAQMKRLQMQISPHFLYNILNSVKILADTGRAEDVSQVTYHLIHLLNACMDRSGMFVTVRQEMETLRHYFAVQQVVYEDTVQFLENMRPELDECEIPNFIFQPIVENSLQHGLDLSRSDNWIRVSDREEDGALLVEIEDNGVGIEPEQLARVRRDMQCDAPVAHIGICSVHQRIRFSCGEEYGIQIESNPGEGVRFTLRLPLNGAKRGG